MKSTDKNLIVKLVLGCLIVFTFSFNVFGYILINGAGMGYEENGGGLAVNGNTIENLVISGANYYLSTSGDIRRFLNLYEIQDENSMDFPGCREVLANAVYNMDHALAAYDRLIKNAGITPYNEVFKARLQAFDYTGFMKENGLNGMIFNTAAAFLKEGNITGLFKHIRSEFENIKGILITINKDVSVNNPPEISAVWRLNEA